MLHVLSLHQHRIIILGIKWSPGKKALPFFYEVLNISHGYGYGASRDGALRNGKLFSARLSEKSLPYFSEALSYSKKSVSVRLLFTLYQYVLRVCNKEIELSLTT